MDWKLGNQLSVKCTLTLTTTTGIPLGAPPGETYTLTEVAAGFEATQTVHFVIDGSLHTAIELGFDLDAMKNLKPVSEFHLTRDDMVSTLQTKNQNEVYNPVNGSRPWMNGFREISTSQDADPVSALSVAISSNMSILIFNTTAPSPFWVVGSATWKDPQASDKLTTT